MTRLSNERLYEIRKVKTTLTGKHFGNVSDLLDHIDTLESDLTTARAECAALLEKLCDKFQKAAEASLNASMPQNALEKQQIVALTFEAARLIVRDSITIPQAAALQEHDSKLQAETAAVLEKLADKWHQTLFPNHTPFNQGQELGMEKCADDVRTAITTDQAAALARVRIEEAEYLFSTAKLCPDDGTKCAECRLERERYMKRIAELRAIVERGEGEGR